MRRHPKRRPQRPSGGTVTLEPAEVPISPVAVGAVLVNGESDATLKLSNKLDLSSKRTTAESSNQSAFADVVQPTLVLRGDGTHPDDKRNETIKQHTDYTETYYYNDEGLSRGEKRANDGSWSERWLQQKVQNSSTQSAKTQEAAPTLVLKSGTTSAPSASSTSVSTLPATAATEGGDAVVFGSATGTNAVLRQRWTEDWRREGSTLTVKKLVQRIDCSEVEQSTDASETERNGAVSEWLRQPQAPVIEEWREESVTDEGTGITTVRLAGRDLVSGRTWQKQSSEHKQGSTSEAEIDSFTGLKIKFKGRFEQNTGTCRRGNVKFVFEDGSSRYMSWCKMDGGEEWNEEWIEDASAAKRGFKSGTNLRGELWKEKWKETAVDRETDRWSRSPCGRKMWGDKHGVAANGQTYDERWYKVREDLDRDSHEAEQVVVLSAPTASPEEECSPMYKEVFFVDKWWTESGNRWGEKRQTLSAAAVTDPTEICFEDDAMTDEGLLNGDVSLNARGVLIEERNEKWHDNGDERVVDLWDKYYTYAPKNDSDTNATNAVLYVKESGNKKGGRASDGSAWGEQWKKERRRRSGTATAVEVDERPIIVTIKTVKQNGTEHTLDEVKNGGADVEAVPTKEEELVISKRVEDKWWRDNNDNSWGNSCFEDLDANRKQHETWYDNGFEKQVDRWQVDEKGFKWGEKFGSKRDGTEWREKWGKGQDGTAETVEREWTEYQDGTRRDWGEKFGHTGDRQWTENWGKMIAQHGNGEGSEWVVKWDDDGFGNSRTEQENRAYREGVETEWSRNQYGECLGSSEKWAHKEGWNRGGDRWMEKWNETPEGKSAEKTGSNAEGDRWREAWMSETTETGENKRRAEKSGATGAGRHWNETWVEDDKSKWARKQCETESGAGWVEEWGESFGDGEDGEKWASKWAKDDAGNRWGSSWGDRWQEGQGHRWGEEWKGEDIRKWAHETSGRPAGA